MSLEYFGLSDTDEEEDGDTAVPPPLGTSLTETVTDRQQAAAAEEAIASSSAAAKDAVGENCKNAVPLTVAAPTVDTPASAPLSAGTQSATVQYLSSAPITSQALLAGASVRLSGLASDELNGQRGTLGRWDQRRGRWTVHLLSDRELLVRPEHLVPDIQCTQPTAPNREANSQAHQPTPVQGKLPEADNRGTSNTAVTAKHAAQTSAAQTSRAASSAPSLRCMADQLW